MNGGSAAARALESLDPHAWRRLTEPLSVGERIPVTMSQWRTIVADSDLLTSIERVRSAIGRVRRASAEGERAAGRDLRPAALGLVEDARQLRDDAADALWFEPPDATGPKTVERRVSRLCVEVADLLDVLTSGEPCLPVLPPQHELSLADFGAGPGVDDEGDDRAARVYGVPVDQLAQLASPAATRLRAAFRSRPEELHAITARIIGYALDGRVAVERLDGAMHVWALATDAHPLVAHRAARAACGLVDRCATEDLQAVATAVIGRLANDRANYSSHRAHSRARRAVHAASDPDDYARAVADVYRIVTEGPLRQAATAVLHILGAQVPATAGLNEIKNRLLKQSDRTPLCAIIAALLVPAWRNASAHEQMHWDPDIGAAVLSGHPVDLEDVLHTADLAWATARGFDAGVQIGRACVPELARAIDAMDRNASPISRDFQLIKRFDQPTLSLVVNNVRRAPASAIITLEPILGPDQLARVGMGLVSAARLEPAVERWGIEFPEELPPFVTGQAAIQLAVSLSGPKTGPDKAWEFIYPPAFIPLLADALTALGMSPAEAAAVAWDLSLRDTLGATAKFSDPTATYRPEMCAHEYAGIRRTNDAVRGVARHLGIRAPANLDLSRLLAILRQIERTPRNPAPREAFAHEQRRLRTLLGPPRSHPWKRLGTGGSRDQKAERRNGLGG